MAQTPLVQVEVALARLQTRPQLPQLLRFELNWTSHPLSALPSQLPKPGVHEIVQEPPEQFAWPLVDTQILPQPPQLAGSVVVVTSQPSLATPLQLPCTVSQSMAHTLPRQAGVPPNALQEVAQLPQCATFDVVSVSQPSSGLLLQSAHPVSQRLTAQLPVVQVPVACGGAQVTPQPPQLFTEFSGVSQPSA